MGNETPKWVQLNDMPWTNLEVEEELANLLELPYERWMQDWPLEVAEHINLEATLTLAEKEERREYLACLLTILIVKLDEGGHEKNHVSEPLFKRIELALLRYPEVMNYWIYSSDDEGINIPEFFISPWLTSIYPNR